MAVKILFLAGILGVIALLIFDTLPSTQEFDKCLNQMSANYGRISSIVRQRDWNSDRFCNATHAQLLVDRVCVQNVIDTKLTARFVFWTSPSRVNINKVLRQHNQQCWMQSVPLYELNIVEEDSTSQ
ncbi:MAG: hypothetical protein NUV98_00250 [Candidatus Roizmanbacteria bacterium]|nr:hypothetical protein [Candidatus Roizmanbacteria bacterium]